MLRIYRTERGLKVLKREKMSKIHLLSFEWPLTAERKPGR